MRRLLVRSISAAFLTVQTAASNASDVPHASTSLLARDDGVLVWIGWRSFIGLLVSVLLVVFSIAVHRKLQRNAFNNWIIDTGCGTTKDGGTRPDSENNEPALKPDRRVRVDTAGGMPTLVPASSEDWQFVDDDPEVSLTIVGSF